MMFVTVSRLSRSLFQPCTVVKTCTGNVARCQLVKTSRCISMGTCAKSDEVIKGTNNAIPVDVKQVKDTMSAPFNPAMDKKRQMILMEIEVFRQSGDFDFTVDDMRDRDWREIMDLASPNQRKRYYHYIMKRKMASEADKRRRERRNAERLAREREIAEETGDHIHYGLGKNTMYFRVQESAITRTQNSKLAHAVLYGQKLVFDLGYNEYMRPKDIRSCVDQMRIGYASNKNNDDPFHVHLCNARQNDPLLQQLLTAVPPLALPKPLITITEKSYLDMFPKNKLVYLTPDCRNDLVEYDHDAVYIIGCFVDMVQSLPLSLAKAKREGLQMARLPIERYVRFSGGGNKSLTLDQVMNIMLSIKDTGDWAVAFKHLPRRKMTPKNYIERGPYRQRKDSLFGSLA